MRLLYDSLNPLVLPSQRGRILAHSVHFVQKIPLWKPFYPTSDALEQAFWSCFISYISLQRALPCAHLHLKWWSAEGISPGRWVYEFPDANVCNRGCKRLHSRLQILASVWDSAIFGYVNNCKSACKCASNMAFSLVRFVSYVRKPCFIRFQPPFLPFSPWLKCKSAGHRSILTDSESTSGKQKVSRMTILRAHLGSVENQWGL